MDKRWEHVYASITKYEQSSEEFERNLFAGCLRYEIQVRYMGIPHNSRRIVDKHLQNSAFWPGWEPIMLADMVGCIDALLDETDERITDGEAQAEGR